MGNVHIDNKDVSADHLFVITQSNFSSPQQLQLINHLKQQIARYNEDQQDNAQKIDTSHTAMDLPDNELINRGCISVLNDIVHLQILLASNR